MFKFIIQKRRLRVIALFMVINLLTSSVLPMTAHALTSGPSQPEVQAFEPIGSTDMVNLFTGDFSYNIPLFEIPGPNGGYPFNLGYNAGIGMDQEASWVGLGWNLNPGAINRQVRGIPDEFNGDEVITKMDVRPDITAGGGVGKGSELFGEVGEYTVGMNVFYNTYNGMGYEPSIGVGFGATNKLGLTAGLNFGLSANSQDGISARPSASIGWKAMNDKSKWAGTNVSIDAGFAYNHKAGITRGTFGSKIGIGSNWLPKPLRKPVAWLSPYAGAQLSFASPAFTPRSTIPARGTNLSAKGKIGAEIFGFNLHATSNVFLTEQVISGEKKAKAYGYLYLQNSTQGDDLMDVSREKDGMVHKTMPNLPIPSLTSDIYTVNGQGISAMYRPFRNEIGSVGDTYVKSTTKGHRVGVDAGWPATANSGWKVGANYGNNHAESVTKKWENNLSEKLQFTNNQHYKDQAVSFRVYGESTTKTAGNYAAIHEEAPVRAILSGNNVVANQVASGKNGKVEAGLDNLLPSRNLDQQREARNTTLLPLTNKELLDENGDEILKEFDVNAISRKDLPHHHLAGFTALNPDGMRYVYGLPVYNHHQAELQYSVDAMESGSAFKSISTNAPNNYKDAQGNGGKANWSYSRNETPKHAYAYLLTAVLGADYVDVGQNGLTKDDLGYWVKFTYKRVHEHYQWRHPYLGGSYQPGHRSTGKDDKAAFSYGEKEIWYLEKVETASHVAIFNTSPRFDAKSAVDEWQTKAVSDLDAQDLDKLKSLHQLDKVSLYTRAAYENTSNPIPIKEVVFTYDYSLCHHTANSLGNYVDDETDNTITTNGKLTLTSLHFTHGRSQRGKLNAYQFNYGNESTNPSYASYQVDRWGNYKFENGANEEDYFDFPYVNQHKTAEEHANMAAAWSLTEIQLPSGGKINVTYEADDYGYVQHKTAMYMTDIEAVSSQELSVNHQNNLQGANLLNLADDKLKVYFRLKEPIAIQDLTGYADEYQQIMKYVDVETMQLYFKTKIQLQNAAINDRKEFVAGYADIVPIPAALGEGITKTAGLVHNDNYYTHGYITVEAVGRGYHPFSVAAWQHIQINQPELFAPKVDPPQKGDSPMKVTKKILSFLNPSILTYMKQMVKGFYRFCDERSWGRNMVAGKSWIRLNVPDKKKFGGGIRVKQITLSDEWNVDGTDGQVKTATYGQKYEYTTIENGETISSGVAAYEPFAGGDEIALRYAVKYTEKVRARNDNNLFTENPINENYFPGAQVGYRKVTVKNLHDGKIDEVASGFHATTGETVHEYYTAKDYPVLAYETDVQRILNKPKLKYTVLKSETRNTFAASQGYSVILNDMHGKPKSVTNYGHDEQGNRLPNPLFWVAYDYKDEVRTVAGKHWKNGQVVDGKEIYVLNNEVETLIDGEEGSTVTRRLGEDYEVFVDSRTSISDASDAGIGANLDVLQLGFFPVPIPSSYPAVSTSYSEASIIVINKVIHRIGVLAKTTAFNDGAMVETANEVWDAVTGQVVLSSVNTSYVDNGGNARKIYAYQIPAHMKYEGMKGAYTNIEVQFTGEFEVVRRTDEGCYAKLKSAKFAKKSLNEDGVEETIWETIAIQPELATSLFSGDELISEGKDKLLYVGQTDTDLMFYVNDKDRSFTAAENLILVRSGYRNHLTANAASITALENPLFNRSAGKTVQFTTPTIK